MEYIRYLTLHASATYPSMDIDIDWIRRIHVDQNGWSDVGYHYFIPRDGKLQIGRPESRQGAHAYRYNADNLGICLAGGLKEGTEEPEDNFTPEQYATLTKLLTELLERHPEARIIGHNGFKGHETRGCPCFDWRAYRDYVTLAGFCQYRPADWTEHDWKLGIPRDWRMPLSWLDEVVTDPAD